MPDDGWSRHEDADRDLGGAGTLSEIALAWIHRRLVIAFRLPGWSGRVAAAPLDERPHCEHVADDSVFGVDSAPGAIAVLRERLDDYLRVA